MHMKERLPFPAQLRYERESRAWSQEKLADKIGCSIKTVARWERGETLPHPSYRSQLCELFGKSVEELGLAPDPASYPIPRQASRSGKQQESSLVISNDTPSPFNETEVVAVSFYHTATTYQSIQGFPPPTHPRAILQREQVVNDIYTKLIQSDITAITLTGIGGAGKSTLAALVYRYSLEHYRAGADFFTAEPIWLTFNERVTIADMLGTLFAILKKPLPDLKNLTPYNQVMTLFYTLSTETQTRLIVLDQFENVLNWQTGNALIESSGIGEWLNIINSQPCMCKILLTSRLRPKGTHEYPPTFLQEYPIEKLHITEGATLLRKQGVEVKQATNTELRAAVTYCDGHALALTLLASLLRQNRNLNLPLLFKNALYTKLWSGNIARNLLEHIYTYQCNELQQKLLFAFAIYREAVPLEAAAAILDLSSEEDRQLLPSLQSLLMQHLIQVKGNTLYDLHAIVFDYIQWKRGEIDGEQNKRSLLKAHAKAVRYYLQQAALYCPPPGQRKYFDQVQPFIEAAWHLCQAEQWQEAYNLIYREGLYQILRQWGENTILLELYQLLQPSEIWHPQEKQEAEICDHLGRIYGIVGKKELAFHYYERALQIYEIIGDRQSKGETLNHLGLLHESLGHSVQAKEFHEQALNISRETGDRKGEANSLNGLGWIYHILGQQEAALDSCEQALRIHQSINNRVGEGDVFNALGLIYYKQEEMTWALACYTQALAIRQEIGNRGGEGRTLNHLGLVYAHLGQIEKAQDYYRQSLKIRKEIGDRDGEGIVLYNLGKVYFKRQYYDVALACFLLARKIFKEVQSTRYEGAQWWIETLQKTIGAHAFAELQTQVANRANQIVEQALAVAIKEIP
jgi:tetratricopeptide (TPR) repeat protein/transcriptional regulator with XRE-family HTH domain